MCQLKCQHQASVTEAAVVSTNSDIRSVARSANIRTWSLSPPVKRATFMKEERLYCLWFHRWLTTHVQSSAACVVYALNTKTFSDFGLLGCDTGSTWRRIPTYWLIIKVEVCRENNRLTYVECSKCLRVEYVLNVDSSEVYFASVLEKYLVRVF
jgi:hypothetical protein